MAAVMAAIVALTCKKKIKALLITMVAEETFFVNAAKLPALAMLLYFTMQDGPIVILGQHYTF